ncbi:unnamed protein product, partial [Ranitomeya imitator]
MIQARKPSSSRIYYRTWKAYFRWCESNRVPPMVFSLPSLLAFLQAGLDSGLALSSLKGQVSALSILFQKTLASRLQVKTFFQGVAHAIPPYRAPVEAWDLNLVLDVLKVSPFEPLREIPLSVLSWKVAFLVAITSIRRVSELAALSCRPPFLVIHQDKVVFRPPPSFLPKVVSTFHLNEDIVLPSFCPAPTHPLERSLNKLDLVRAFLFSLFAFCFLLCILYPSQADDCDSKRDSLEEGELRDHRMEITIRNSPYRREDSMEDRGEEDDSLAIKPPQQVSRKEKSHHRKDEKKKEKRRHRSHSAEGKYMRAKEKDREPERRKRHREEQDKVRRERERLKRRELAREHSRRERDRLEQLERNRERERKLWEQQKELKERHRRAEERRKGREARREAENRCEDAYTTGLAGSALSERRKPGLLQETERMQYSAESRILVEFSTQISAHHRTAREEHGDKNKATYRSRSPMRQQRQRVETGEMWKHVKDDRPDVRDLLSDLQDISDNERKSSSAESSSAGSVSVEEEETSSEESEEAEEEEEDYDEEEEEETASNSDAVSEQTAEEISDEEMSEEEERANGNRVPIFTESRFDHDSAESEEEEEEEEQIRIASPHSNVQAEGEFVPDPPVVTPIELKQELPKYLPALQGCRSVEEFQCLNRVEEGTYGVVYRAKDKKTGENAGTSEISCPVLSSDVEEGAESAQMAPVGGDCRAVCRAGESPPEEKPEVEERGTGSRPLRKPGPKLESGAAGEETAAPEQCAAEQCGNLPGPQDEIFALKRLKMEKEKEGFPITSLREINTILKAQHENIVRVREIVVGSNMDKIYIVMNYMEHDLKRLMETMKQPFLPGWRFWFWLVNKIWLSSKALYSHRGHHYGIELQNFCSVLK